MSKLDSKYKQRKSADFASSAIIPHPAGHQLMAALPYITYLFSSYPPFMALNGL